MKTTWKRFATSALAVVMLLTVLMPTVSGITVFWGDAGTEGSGSVSSAQAPDGYVPLASQSDII